MHRFIRLTLLGVALSSLSSAAIITMNTTAGFLGGLDLSVNAPDNGTTTRILSTFSAPGATGDLDVLGEIAFLPLGTLQIGEQPGDSTPPDITASEFDNGYQLTITIDTNLGVLNFLATNGFFSTVNFSPGASDNDTTDAAEEIVVNFGSIFQDITIGMITLRLSIVDDENTNDGTLELNQDGTAETVWMRAEVIDVDGPPNGEIPEPSTMAIMGAGLLGLGFVARRRRVRHDLRLA